MLYLSNAPLKVHLFRPGFRHTFVLLLTLVTREMRVCDLICSAGEREKEYRIVSNKRSPSNKRPLTYFQIKLGKMPKFLYDVSL